MPSIQWIKLESCFIQTHINSTGLVYVKWKSGGEKLFVIQAFNLFLFMHKSNTGSKYDIEALKFEIK